MKLANTKQIKGAYQSYLRSDCDSLWEAYNKPSSNKVSAWQYCKNLCKEYDGKNLRILGHSCHFFSVGFIGTVEGKKSFIYITAGADRYMILED